MEFKAFLKAGTIVIGALLLVAGAVQTASAQTLGQPDAGTFQQGYELGMENGSIMVGRVRRQTIERNGCNDLHRLQTALVRVQRAIRAPSGSSDRFVRGFNAGYRRALNMGLREARAQCGISSFYDGEIPGQLGGAQFCSLLESGPAYLDGFEFEPVYEGWTTDDDVKTSCKVAFQAVARECSAGLPLESSILVAQQSACI
jgi:hypothetical protein